MDYFLNIDIEDIRRRNYSSIRKINNAVVRGINGGIRDLATLTEMKLVDILSDYGLLGSDLASTIRVEYEKDGVRLTVGAEYAIYVEYGTGIVGSSHPHPNPQMAWEYDINDHGTKGWKYPKKTGGYGITSGQPSRPFMYKAYMYILANAERVINKNVEHEISKVLRGG